MQNENNGIQTPNNDSNLEKMRQIKSAQTLVTVATIAAPVSLLFGGTLLSSVALICALVGRSKLNKISGGSEIAEVLAVAAKSTRMTIIMCVIALALNIFSMVTMYPVYLEALESGDLSNLIPFGSSAESGSLPSAGNQPSSVWG